MRFVSRYQATAEVYRTFVKKVALRNSLIGCIALGVIMFILAIVALLLHSLVVSCINLALALFFFFVVYKSPRNIVSRYLSKAEQLHGGKVVDTIITFDENKITREEGEYEATFEYESFIQYIRMENCSALMYNQQHGVLFDESNFEEGNPAEFEAFILEKCPNVQGVIVRK